MDVKLKKRTESSCSVLRTIKNFENKANIIKSIPRPPKKNRELRNLEAELGVEKYKNQLLAEEIQQHKVELLQTNKYETRLKLLRADYTILASSVRRSRDIQEEQEEEIEYLKRMLSLNRTVSVLNPQSY